MKEKKKSERETWQRELENTVEYLVSGLKKIQREITGEVEVDDIERVKIFIDSQFAYIRNVVEKMEIKEKARREAVNHFLNRWYDHPGELTSDENAVFQAVTHHYPGDRKKQGDLMIAMMCAMEEAEEKGNPLAVVPHEIIIKYGKKYGVLDVFTSEMVAILLDKIEKAGEVFMEKKKKTSGFKVVMVDELPEGLLEKASRQEFICMLCGKTYRGMFNHTCGDDVTEKSQ